MTLAKGHLSVLSKFQIYCPLKLLGQFQLNFICSVQANGERKLIYLVYDTCPRWPFIPIYSKHF